MKKFYSKHVVCFVSCIAVILFFTGTLYATTRTDISDTGSVKSSPPQKQEDKSAIKNTRKTAHQPLKSEVLAIQINEISSDSTIYNRQIRVDNKVSLLISNPRDFLLQRPSDKSDLILYADGFPLTGITSTYFSHMSAQDANDTLKVWPDSMWIPFIFKRDSTSTDAWNNLFRLAHWNKNQISFNVSLGWAGMFPLPNTNGKKVNTRVSLLFYNTRAFWGLIILYLALIVYFIRLCHTTGLIRDPDYADKTKKGPYSLSQTQLAFWTIIIIGGFIYLIVLTGLCDSLNDSCLLLLGISGGTTGIASFIDYYKKQATNQPPVIQAQVPAGQAAPAAQAGAAPIQAISYKEHRTFLLDILSDGVNVSVQRTQIALWNLVLGFYFVWYVISNKSMPVFSNTLLTLAGVSSLLYLAGKGPENPTPAKQGQ